MRKHEFVFLWKVLEDNAGMRLADLIRILQENLKIGETKARNLVLDNTRPYQSKKNGGFFSPLVDNTEINISPPYTIFRLHEDWQQENEKNIENFYDVHIDPDFILTPNSRK